MPRSIAIRTATALFAVSMTAATTAAASQVPATTGGAPAGLQDVATHWARPQIEAALAAGYVTGYPDGSFRPDAPITRAEFFKLLATALRFPPQPGGSAFIAETSHWSVQQGYIQAAVEAGLLNPPDYAGRLGPDVSITRREIVLAGVRAVGTEANVNEQNPGLTAPDAAAYPAWLQGWAARAMADGIIGGYPDGSLGLQRTATRAEALIIIQRILGKVMATLSSVPANAPPAGNAARYAAAGEPTWTVSENAEMRPVLSNGTQSYTFPVNAWGIRLRPAPGNAVWVSYVVDGATWPETVGVLGRLQNGKMQEVARYDGRSADLIAVDARGRLFFTDGQDRLLLADVDGTARTINGVNELVAPGQLDAAGNLWVVGDHGWPPVVHLYRITPDGTAIPFDAGLGAKETMGLLGVTGNGSVWTYVRRPAPDSIPMESPFFEVLHYTNGKRDRRLTLMRYYEAGQDGFGVFPLAREGQYVWVERENQTGETENAATRFFRFDLVTGTMTPVIAPLRLAEPVSVVAAPDTTPLLRDNGGTFWLMN